MYVAPCQKCGDTLTITLTQVIHQKHYTPHRKIDSPLLLDTYYHSHTQTWRNFIATKQGTTPE